jgi:hypothetical protein
MPTTGDCVASKITAAQRKQFLAELAEGNSPEKSARVAGTSRRSVGRLRQGDEAFALDYADAYESGVDLIEQKLLDIAAGRDPGKAHQVTALCAVLNARRSEFYRNGNRVALSAKEGAGGTIEVRLSFDPVGSGNGHRPGVVRAPS